MELPKLAGPATSAGRLRDAASLPLDRGDNLQVLSLEAEIIEDGVWKLGRGDTRDVLSCCWCLFTVGQEVC